MANSCHILFERCPDGCRIDHCTTSLSNAILLVSIGLHHQGPRTANISPFHVCSHSQQLRKIRRARREREEPGVNEADGRGQGGYEQHLTAGMVNPRRMGTVSKVEAGGQRGKKLGMKQHVFRLRRVTTCEQSKFS